MLRSLWSLEEKNQVTNYFFVEKGCFFVLISDKILLLRSCARVFVFKSFRFHVQDEDQEDIWLIVFTFSIILKPDWPQ